MDLYNWNNI